LTFVKTSRHPTTQALFWRFGVAGPRLPPPTIVEPNSSRIRSAAGSTTDLPAPRLALLNIPDVPSRLSGLLEG